MSGLSDKDPGPSDRGLRGGKEDDPRRNGGASGLAREGDQSSLESLWILFWFLALPPRQVVVRG